MNGERGSEWVGWEYSLISDSDPPPLSYEPDNPHDYPLLCLLTFKSSLYCFTPG